MAADTRFRIISPQHLDRYRVPPDTDPRYATVALRTIGSDRPEDVLWFIDGEPMAERRWRLRSGSHIIRAESPGGDWDEIKIYVD